MDNKWYELEKKLIDWLSKFSSENMEFRNSHQAIIGFPSDGFRSDGMLTDGKVLISIEVEAGQTHPDTNVGKYWMLFDKHKQYSKIILFHIFTPEFNSYESRKELGLFYANKMKDVIPFEYKLREFREPANFDDVFKKVKSEIQLAVEENFGIS